jgi:malate dehydrogenase (oxaloacetate-decarboxylating)
MTGVTAFAIARKDISLRGIRQAREWWVAARPSASFSATLRVHLADRPGAFAALARAIGEAGGSLGAIDLVRVEPREKVRDVTVDAGSAEHMDAIVAAVRAVPGIEVERVSDRTFLLHLGGKIEVAAKAPPRTRDDLSLAYTPGVAPSARRSSTTRRPSGT